MISAYVGADITSGILVTRLAHKKGLNLFIDIGTNGEMVLAKDGRLAASSTAAGPAFEGMNISCGMRAGAGAVESFTVDDSGSLSYKTIGDTKAAGICGSGLLDIAGELVRTGLINKNGRLVSPDGGAYPPALKERMGHIDGKNAFFISGDVYLSQKDIRQIQLAKGAIRCGIEMLLSRFDVTAEEVGEVIIGGSFGYHLNERSLVNIGLLPPQCAGKITFAGNTSLSGAAAFLLNVPFREEMRKLAAGG
ncbi:MAG: ASKHA domain-containing protein [Treponema sp.]|nr:ASKHA domain-containing protein [Treponema sp.]